MNLKILNDGRRRFKSKLRMPPLREIGFLFHSSNRKQVLGK